MKIADDIHSTRLRRLESLGPHNFYYPFRFSSSLSLGLKSVVTLRVESMCRLRYNAHLCK